jgi:hypothetical protein
MELSGERKKKRMTVNNTEMHKISAVQDITLYTESC